jgi:hypothetical protein
MTMKALFQRAVPGPLVALALCLFSIGALAQVSAARVMSVSGNVKVVDAQGKERALIKGAEIKAGEKIVTADGALVQIRMNDGGFMSIRPGTEMVIDRFNYDERKPAESGMLISLLRGGMRSITGLIGKANPDGYQIRSSTATVGIRGTDHEPMVIPPNVPELAKLGAPGLYDKVNEGETFIRNQAGLLSIKRGEIGFTAANAPTVIPQALKVIPEFYRVELKVDARDPKEAASIDTQGRAAAAPAPAAGGLLRPTTAARREALIQSGALTPITSDVAVPDRTLSVTSVQPVSTSTLVVPSAALTSSVTTVQPLSATSATAASTSAIAVPLTSTLSTMTPAISSSVSTSALIAPVSSFTTLSPSVTSSVSSTLVAPMTSTITTLSPAISSSLSTSTLSSSALSTSALSSTTLSTTKLIAPTVPTSTVLTPTTTITPTLSTTTISPALSTTTIKILK